MTMLEDLTQQLRVDEGEVLHAYQDHLGYWTIGVGILIDKRKGGGITAQESAYLLGNRIMEKAAELDRRLSWWRELDEVRQGALLNMAFQMGVDGLLGFKNTLALIKAHQFTAAATGMLNSKWAKQTPERANRLAQQIRTGQWIFGE